jgi:hypothetical protein
MLSRVGDFSLNTLDGPSEYERFDAKENLHVEE